MVDGARNALLGYLYQLLGTAAVSIREVASAADAWAQLVARVDQGTLVSEEFGQDAAVHPAARPDLGVTAIQFKHSSAVGSLIGRAELIEILIAFDRSRREAAARGVAIEHFALVTNRDLDPRAQLIVGHRNAKRSHPSLRLATTRGGEPVATNLKRLEMYGGDTTVAEQSWHSIIRLLAVFPGETFEGDVQRLRDFAARYGVLDREWSDRLDALVGAFVRETAGGRTVDLTREWLKEHLIGDRDAANLRFGSPFEPHITTVCRARLDQRTRNQHRVAPKFYLERDVQRELHSQLEQHSVVFVAGGGGRGKSLSVVNYLQSVVSRRLVWSEGAATASERHLVEAVTNARLPGGLRGGMDHGLVLQL